MELVRELKNLRSQLGMNQEEFGALFGYSKSSISNIETGEKEIPNFMIEKAVIEFNAMGLALEKCQSCKSNHFIPARVDVDSTPAEVLDILIDEFQEAIEAAKRAKNELKLHNRKTREWLSENEFRKLVDCTEQIYDPMTGIVKWLEVFQKNYKGSVKEIQSRNTTKLYDNGAKRQKTPARQQSVLVNSY